MDMLNIEIYEEAMCGMSKAQFKFVVRKVVISATFTSLKTIQLSHRKVRNIQYPIVVLQPSCQSDFLLHEKISLLFNMRADTPNGLKFALQMRIVMIDDVSLTAIMKIPSKMHFSVLR